MPSLTVENYAKTIYLICAQQNGAAAATGQIALQLKVSPGSVTSMLKTLSESGLATYMPYEGVRLTSAGEALALRMVRRHRLIELFLVRTLGLSWDEVHEEAEHMEHAVSDWLVARIDTFLGHPESDPHGDPIPRADGSVAAPQDQPLGQFTAGDRVRLSRVLEQSPDFLRYLSEMGLVPGVTATIKARRPEAGVLVLELSGREQTLSLEASGKLMATAESA